MSPDLYWSLILKGLIIDMTCIVTIKDMIKEKDLEGEEREPCIKKLELDTQQLAIHLGHGLVSIYTGPGR